MAIEFEAEIGEDTACDIYQWLREVCSTKLLQLPGVIVQIDESQFKHKPKVIYHHYISAPVPSSPILLFILKTVDCIEVDYSVIEVNTCEHLFCITLSIFTPQLVGKAHQLVCPKIVLDYVLATAYLAS